MQSWLITLSPIISLVQSYHKRHFCYYKAYGRLLIEYFRRIHTGTAKQALSEFWTKLNFNQSNVLDLFNWPMRRSHYITWFDSSWLACKKFEKGIKRIQNIFTKLRRGYSGFIKRRIQLCMQFSLAPCWLKFKQMFSFYFYLLGTVHRDCFSGGRRGKTSTNQEDTIW